MGLQIRNIKYTWFEVKEPVQTLVDLHVLLRTEAHMKTTNRMETISWIQTWGRSKCQPSPSSSSAAAAVPCSWSPFWASRKPKEVSVRRARLCHFSSARSRSTCPFRRDCGTWTRRASEHGHNPRRERDRERKTGEKLFYLDDQLSVAGGGVFVRAGRRWRDSAGENCGDPERFRGSTGVQLPVRTS